MGKKILSLILAAVMTVGLAGCAGSEVPEESGTISQQEEPASGGASETESSTSEIESSKYPFIFQILWEESTLWKSL